MEFKGQYLTYEEYKALGGTLDLTPFNLLEFEARRRIDGKTLNRLINVEKIPQEVKLCIFNLINTVKNYIDNENTNQNWNISSESTDGYSVSYITPAQIKDVVESRKQIIDDNIDNDLFGVVVNGKHILYCGI